MVQRRRTKEKTLTDCGNWTRLVILSPLSFLSSSSSSSSSWDAPPVPLPRLLPRLLLLPMRSPGWPTSASRQPGYEKRIVVSAGFCGAGAAMPAESNCWYSLAVSRIKNRQGLRRRKFIRSAARNKWEASFVRVHRARILFFLSFISLHFWFFLSLFLSSPLFFNSSVRFVLYFFPFCFFIFFQRKRNFCLAIEVNGFRSLGRVHRIIGSFKVDFSC